MSLPQTATLTLVAANATAVCASQTPAAGAMILNGSTVVAGVAVLDVARRISIATAGADAGKIITVQGTDRNGNPAYEKITLVSAGTVGGSLDFKTVTSASISGSAAGAITIGTNSTASTKWFRIDFMRGVYNTSIAMNFGTSGATVTVEGTLDPTDKSFVDSSPTGNMDSSVAGLNTSTFGPPWPFVIQSGLTTDATIDTTAPMAALRATVTAGGNTGGLRLTVLQQGA